MKQAEYSPHDCINCTHYKKVDKECKEAYEAMRAHPEEFKECPHWNGTHYYYATTRED